MQSCRGQDEGSVPVQPCSPAHCPLPQAITGPPGAKGEKVRSQAGRAGLGEGLLGPGTHSGHS